MANDTYERFSAIREGFRNAAEETWFTAIPSLEQDARKAFARGFDAGYKHSPAAALTSPVAPEQVVAERNQCDGCALALETNERGHHRYADGSLIACTAGRYAASCICGKPEIQGVTHRTDGPCFIAETHQDFHPLAASPEAAPAAPLLMQDESSGRDGRRYNEWHASRPDARLNAREAAAATPAAPSAALAAAERLRKGLADTTVSDHALHDDIRTVLAALAQPAPVQAGAQQAVSDDDRIRRALETLVDCVRYGDVRQDADAWDDARAALRDQPSAACTRVGLVTNEREAFENTLKEMPNWEPEYEMHRSWVEAFAWNVWQTRAMLSENSMECTTCGALVVGVAAPTQAGAGDAKGGA